MSRKSQVICFALLALTAMSAIAVMNASAKISGHFTSDASEGHTLIAGSENSTHFLRFSVEEGTAIRCTNATYSGTSASATTESITVTPHYTECETDDGTPNPGEVVVDHEGCNFVFYSNTNASTHSPTEHATVDVECPKNVSGIRVTHPNCTIIIPPQSLKGVTYTTLTNATTGKHEITLNSTVSNITSYYEENTLCQFFFGTGPHTATMTGSATVKGTNTAGTQANITAT